MSPKTGRIDRFVEWVKGPERPPNPPPEWVFSPWIAALALAAPVGLAFSPVVPLALIIWPVLGVQVYEDHRVNGLGQAWPSVVATLGPLAYPFYIRERNRLLASLPKLRPPVQRADGTAIAPSEPLPPDWYPDPTELVRVRYWDGSNWTRFGAR
jgi:hypothetical protein